MNKVAVIKFDGNVFNEKDMIILVNNVKYLPFHARFQRLLNYTHKAFNFQQKYEADYYLLDVRRGYVCSRTDQL